MKKQILFGSVLLLCMNAAFAANCPDPGNSSLLWGEVPPSWELSPFSENSVQGEEGTQFTRANILVAGRGHGVACTYENSLGYYTIWKQASVHVPASMDYNWHKTLGGYECTASVAACLFYF
ncbi:DUF3757 domain-containing protein [Legionella londiniensis]|uniref:DUF3757 domain-containing protein n=1 Tax=Legionella londiniensis TaxID=45068 RepID=A0A0W0VQM6_9GAMM|nr:DUF3757 domain-containing protein [Legionella londiniensis]KTD22389.1 hypothetical protein Llon_0607 [Legionella londiniensis]STX93037.1 Uncharacterised protein [Legionella londiniensis]